MYKIVRKESLLMCLHNQVLAVSSVIIAKFYCIFVMWTYICTLLLLLSCNFHPVARKDGNTVMVAVMIISL